MQKFVEEDLVLCNSTLEEVAVSMLCATFEASNIVVFKLPLQGVRPVRSRDGKRRFTDTTLAHNSRAALVGG